MRGEELLNAYRVSVWEDDEVLEMDSGDGCMTVGMYFKSCTLKNG